MIDLHLHLDGSLSVEIVKKLAEMQNMILPVYESAELKKLLCVPKDCESLNDYLNLPNQHLVLFLLLLYDISIDIHLTIESMKLY